MNKGMDSKIRSEGSNSSGAHCTPEPVTGGKGEQQYDDLLEPDQCAITYVCSTLGCLSISV